MEVASRKLHLWMVTATAILILVLFLIAHLSVPNKLCCFLSCHRVLGLSCDHLYLEDQCRDLFHLYVLLLLNLQRRRSVIGWS